MDPIKEKSKFRLISSILMTLLFITFYQVYFRIEIKEVDDIEKGLFGLSVLDDTTGQTITPGTAVSVGDEMRISVTASDTAILDFYLSECTATNGKDPSASDYKFLNLIEDDGCMVDNSAIWPLPASQPASPNPGQYIDYRQFGFADNSGSKYGRVNRPKIK